MAKEKGKKIANGVLKWAGLILGLYGGVLSTLNACRISASEPLNYYLTVEAKKIVGTR